MIDLDHNSDARKSGAEGNLQEGKTPSQEKQSLGGR